MSNHNADGFRAAATLAFSFFFFFYPLVWPRLAAVGASESSTVDDGFHLWWDGVATEGEEQVRVLTLDRLCLKCHPEENCGGL